MKFISAFKFSLLTAMAFLSSYSTANMSPELDLFNLSLEELGKIEVTGATLQPLTLRKVPAAVTVFTREQIDLYGFTNLTSLLNYISGYQVQRSDSSSFSSSVSARSLKTNGSAREILILIDGQRLNDDWLGGAGYLLSNLPLAHVKRIEVIKGAGSAIFGSNAYTGVINIITGMISKASLSVGLHGATKLSGQFKHSFKQGNVSGFISKEDYQGENVEIFDPFTNNNEKTSDPFQAELLYLKASWNDFEINISHQKNESQEFYTLGFVSGDDNFLSMKQQFIRVKHQIDLNDKWHLKTQLFMSTYEFRVGGKIIPAPIETFIKGTIAEQDNGGELVLTYSGMDEERFLFGVEYRVPKLTNTDAETFGAFNLYLPQAPTNGRTIKGAYIQYQNSITENVGYIIGARQDDYSNFGSHLSPRLGINWQISNEHVVKFLYGNSFRAPSRSETDATNSSVIIANPNLQPEVFSAYDVIWMYSSKSMYLTADLFYNEVQDAILPSQTVPFIYRNESGGSSIGVDLDLLYVFNKQWQVRMNMMKVANDDKTLYSDSNLAAGLIISYATDTSTYSLLANYQSKKIDANSSAESFSILPARTKIDAYAKWALNDSLDLSLNVYNLLDKNSYGTAYRSTVIGGVKEKSRHVALSLQWKY